MKAKYKPIAMKCNQQEFDSIKDMIPLPIAELTSFSHCNYLVNNLGGNKRVSNLAKHNINDYGREVFETFDGKYFLECCGVQVLEDVSEKVWKGSDMQVKCIYDEEWQDCNKNTEYRLKPKPNIDADIEALKTKAKELGIEIEIITK